MACYAALGLLAWLTLDRTPRLVVWLFLAFFALRTWVAARRGAAAPSRF